MTRVRTAAVWLLLLAACGGGGGGDDDEQDTQRLAVSVEPGVVAVRQNQAVTVRVDTPSAADADLPRDGSIGCQVSGGQPRTCRATYSAGSTVTLYADPLPGSNLRLETWLGDCASFGALREITITIDRDWTCSAAFVSA